MRWFGHRRNQSPTSRRPQEDLGHTGQIMFLSQLGDTSELEEVPA